MKLMNSKLKTFFAAVLTITVILSSVSNVFAVLYPTGPFVLDSDTSGYKRGQIASIGEVCNWRTQHNIIYTGTRVSLNPTRDISPNENWIFYWNGNGHFEIIPSFDKGVEDIDRSAAIDNLEGLRLTVSGDSVTLAEPSNSMNQKWDIYTISVAPPSINPFALSWKCSEQPNWYQEPKEGDHFIIVSAANGKALACQPASGQSGVIGPVLKNFTPGSFSEDMFWDFWAYSRNGLEADKSIKLTIGQLTYKNRTFSSAFDVAPYIDSKSGRTMVPVRFIAQALGARVDWVDSIKTDYITLGGKTLSIALNKPLPNGMGTAVIVQDRLFVPIRYVSEQLGAKVDWDDKTKTVTIR